MAAPGLPKKRDLVECFVALKKTIHDDYRAGGCEEDTAPSMDVTIGATCEDCDAWSYQTGDNSFTGGAYGYPHWAVVTLHRRSSSRELADEVLNQLADLWHGAQ